MKVVVVIPARYDSSRFRGKVLAKETGKYLVQHTYERALCAKRPEMVLIATDSVDVMAACKGFGAECVMTSAAHVSGTDRIAEAVKDVDAEVILNLQADEPDIDPADIDHLAGLLSDNPTADMATLVAEFDNAEAIADPNIVKAIVDKAGRAIYFSRSPIPYDRQAGGVGLGSQYLRHMGIYAFRKAFLMTFTALEQGALEKIEKLEQLRAIEHGYTIITGKVGYAWEGIDTPEQYEAFVKRHRQDEE
ncbi:MAG: 3-deoxy-manno-octulosonate cytidylyltransferase [Planctomycetota bacterium]|nr:MAG: 3-deoxy-manno-octulosonate cytidylyltransferase [Planctomycetota bacterium]